MEKATKREIITKISALLKEWFPGGYPGDRKLDDVETAVLAEKVFDEIAGHVSVPKTPKRPS
ncbi:MAG: hypothetical protein AABZ67_00500 [Pseudomonadota bacterium]